MVEAELLFNGRDDEGDHNNRVHLTQVIELIELPPRDFLERRTESWRAFDHEGTLNTPSKSVHAHCLFNVDETQVLWHESHGGENDTIHWRE